MKSSVSSLGRLRIISELVDSGGFILNLGCKTTQLGGVGVDVSKEVYPSIVADARQLPFRAQSFDQVVFSDVIEHLPKGAERKALREIWRVLRTQGSLVLSTPNDFFPFNVLDPAWYLGHRHYKAVQILSLLEGNGFEIHHISSRGWVFAALCSLLFANRWLVRFCPDWLVSNTDLEYSGSETNGYTLFVVASKKTVLSC